MIGCSKREDGEKVNAGTEIKGADNQVQYIEVVRAQLVEEVLEPFLILFLVYQL